MKTHIIISGGSGVGKSRLLNRIRALRPDLKWSVSWTTRSPREEEDDSSYRFVSRDDFEKGIRENAFVEWVCVSENYYGTPRCELAPGERMIYDVDTNGGLALKKAYPPDETMLIFITASEEKILRRLTEREAMRMDPAEIEFRMSRLKEETSRAWMHYHHIVENDKFEDCLSIILRIIDEAWEEE